MAERKKRELTSVDIRSVQAEINAALSADEEMSTARLVRESIRFWLGNAPQATNSDETWILLAFRAIKKADQGLWAGAMLNLHGYAKPFGRGLEPTRYAQIDSLSGKHERGGASESAEIIPEVKKNRTSSSR